MRRSVIFPAVVLLALLSETGVAGGSSRLSGLASDTVESLFPGPSADEVAHLMRDPAGRVTDGLRVMFLQTMEEDFGLYGMFLITNESPEDVAYWSWDNKHGFADSVKQRGVIHPRTSACATGLGAGVLRPGESAVFGAKIPDKHAAFEAEFRFMVSGGGWKTVWSDTVFLEPNE